MKNRPFSEASKAPIDPPVPEKTFFRVPMLRQWHLIFRETFAIFKIRYHCPNILDIDRHPNLLCINVCRNTRVKFLTKSQKLSRIYRRKIHFYPRAIPHLVRGWDQLRSKMIKIDHFCPLLAQNDPKSGLPAKKRSRAVASLLDRREVPL